MQVKTLDSKIVIILSQTITFLFVVVTLKILQCANLIGGNTKLDVINALTFDWLKWFITCSPLNKILSLNFVN